MKTHFRTSDSSRRTTHLAAVSSSTLRDVLERSSQSFGLYSRTGATTLLGMKQRIFLGRAPSSSLLIATAHTLLRLSPNW